jgi:hypothetical protein
MAHRPTVGIEKCFPTGVTFPNVSSMLDNLASRFKQFPMRWVDFSKFLGVTPEFDLSCTQLAWKAGDMSRDLRRLDSKRPSPTDTGMEKVGLALVCRW